MADTELKERLYKLAARELSMSERPEYVRNAVDVVIEDPLSVPIAAFLRSLRDSLVSGRGETNDG